MLSISTKVERIVTESPFLSEGLRRGLINLSELARQLQPQLQNDLWKPVGQAAVVMALRRVAGRLPDKDAQELVLAQQSGQLTLTQNQHRSRLPRLQLLGRRSQRTTRLDDGEVAAHGLRDEALRPILCQRVEQIRARHQPDRPLILDDWKFLLGSGQHEMRQVPQRIDRRERIE